MLAKVLDNSVIAYLFRHSHFKPAQLDSLLVKRSATANRLQFKDSLRYRDKPTSVGSAARSARQAEAVISKSVATLVLALHLGLVSEDVILAIPKIKAALASAGEASNADALPEAIGLLDAFLKRASRP